MLVVLSKMNMALHCLLCLLHYKVLQHLCGVVVWPHFVCISLEHESEPTHSPGHPLHRMRSVIDSDLPHPCAAGTYHGRLCLENPRVILSRLLYCNGPHSKFYSEPRAGGLGDAPIVP